MIKLDDLFAAPGYAPKDYQVTDSAHFFQQTACKPPVRDSPDLRRILSLATRPPVEEESDRGRALVRMMTARYAIQRTTPCRCTLPREQGGYERDCITTLNLTQAWALYELGIVQGLVGPIGVGHGKTILDILSILAMMPPGEPNPSKYEAVLLVPPGLVEQLVNEYLLIREHFRVPSLAVHGRDVACDAGPGAPVLHVLPYSRLQRPEATVLLERIKPRAIIADEAHGLRNPDAVRTGRVIRYIERFPSTRFACWTGSITDSSIGDYAHLSKFALGANSPLPLDGQVVKEWATALDPKSEWPADPGALLDGLIEYGFQPVGAHVHVGFHKRLTSTEGVVATRSSAIKAKLEVSERVPPPMPHELSIMLDNVREIQQRPDGEELITPLEISKCARELACGFYYKRIYPEATDEELAPGGLVDTWELRRALYRREVRERLKDRREHLDSPYLCQLAAMRYHGDIARGGVVEIVDEESGELVRVDTTHLPVWKSDHWPAWRDIKDKVKPDKETVRVDDYLARDSAQWAHENRGIVWYDKTAFGIWVAELSGLPMYGGGANGGGLLDPMSGHIVERGDRSIILSIKAHGTGRDGLQMLFWNQLVANPPSSSASWEQLLGRLHRIRQRSELVSAFFYCHTEELERSFDQARARAQYVQGTIGADQKLNAAFEDE